MLWLFLVFTIVIAVVLYLFPKIDATLRKLLIAAACILFLLWILSLLGVLPVPHGFYGDRRIIGP